MQKKFPLLICFFILLNSCRSPRIIYSPSPPNNPYFREKGESKLAGYYSSGGDDNSLTKEYNHGFDLQSAYAVTNHFALTSGYFQRKEKDILFPIYTRRHFDSSVINYNRHITDFGGGYFTQLGSSKIVFFNLFGGIGFGKFSFTDNGLDSAGMNYNRFYNSKITKWYIQPALNIFASEHFKIGLIGKYCRVHYKTQGTSYTTYEENYLDLDKLKKTSLGFFESTLNMQVSMKGAEWINLDGGFTFSSEPFDNSINLEARNFNASIGLGINFSRLKKK